MKWLNQIHHVGDSLVIERTTLTNKKIRQIVKLLAVYSIYGFEDDQQFPLVEVQFYCGKEELHQQMRERYGDCLSDCEVFLTPETGTYLLYSRHSLRGSSAKEVLRSALR